MMVPGKKPRTFAWFRMAVLVASACLAWTGASSAAAGPGDPLPPISLVDTATSQPAEVGALLKGSVGALVYMQTSCAACRKELSFLKDLQLKYPQFKVVAVSVDAGEPDRVLKYREHFAFEFPFLHDPDFKTPELFGFAFTPGLVLVGRDGTVALVKGGYRPGDETEVEGKVAALTAAK